MTDDLVDWRQRAASFAKANQDLRAEIADMKDQSARIEALEAALAEKEAEVAHLTAMLDAYAEMAPPREPGALRKQLEKIAAKRAALNTPDREAGGLGITQAISHPPRSSRWSG